MSKVIRRRRVLHAGLALGAALVAPAARACEFFAGNFTVIHPWTRASAEGATTAIVCMTFQDVTQTDRLVGARTIIAAGAEMGGDGAGPAVDFVVQERQTSVLSESGVHLRLVGLRFPLVMGREYPMSLFFEKAGAINARLTVDYERLA